MKEVEGTTIEQTNARLEPNEGKLSYAAITAGTTGNGKNMPLSTIEEEIDIKEGDISIDTSGSFPRIKPLLNRINSLWHTKGEYNDVDLENDYFLYRFLMNNNNNVHMAPIPKVREVSILTVSILSALLKLQNAKMVPIPKGPTYSNGANYAYWKNMMMLFIQANDLRAWNSIMKGYSTPPGEMDDWSVGEKKKFQINAKGMHILFCALGPNKYERVSSCSNAKKIWDKLQVTYEGTDEVREAKIILLNNSYKNFKMKPDENIKAMTDRFSVIVNGLKGFGEVIPNKKLVRKMIYSLPKSWQSNKEMIIEAKNLKSLTLDELIGITFKSTNESNQESNEEVDEDDNEEEEIAKIFKRFKRFMTFKKVKHESRKKKSPPVCFNCQRTGHVKYECPLLKKKGSSKKKEFMEAWSDEDDYNDEDEVANLCLMAIE
ncbi:hypothetical protein F3Y22_tig00111582pilonHSYRG00510 [Hibiscus syriacus]|uniref:CCHC-type domain-containing protein n=1 Tax=Hibiscus syriacus TaxID=106335 RepID=A0A6A2XK78_HIBSY|nr:hypothetical protein F3Y22_tig00111582pilonHSYRG00510 [Hibiscus syriacus]